MTIAGAVSDEQLVEDLRKNLRDNGKETLTKLYEGLDVSPIFAWVDGFDFTANNQQAIFSLAGVRLLHAWYVGDKEWDLFKPLREMSYDEVTLLAAEKSGDDEDEVAQLCKAFIAEYPCQFSPVGHAMVHQAMSDNEVAVLFLNGHFSTILKRGGKLLRLASDESYSDKPFLVFELIWEERDITGYYCDGSGQVLSKPVLEILLRPNNSHTYGEVIRAVERAHQEGNHHPAMDDLLQILAPSAAAGRVSPAAGASAGVIAAPSPQRVTFAAAPPAAAAPLGEAGQQSPAEIAAAVRQMGFVDPDMEAHARRCGSVQSLLDYLVDRPDV
jgi:hypothetical protein